VPGNVAYVGDSRWRNTVLWDLREAGRLVAVERPAGMRDADDRKIIAFARESNAMICSNDRYEDHIAGAGSTDASKELRRWLAANRTGYEFSVGTPEDAAYKQGKPRVDRPPVGCSHLAPPPKENGKETIGGGGGAANGGGAGAGDGGASAHGINDDGDGVDAGDGAMEWRADVHAVGSSRPWALGVNRWGKDKKGGGGRKGRGKRRRRHTLGQTGGGGRKGEGSASSSGSESELDDPEFPFWALPDEDLPVAFNLKKPKL
jgi:hypothetical protein